MGEKLWQISWRPRPPLLLSQGRQRDVRKNIKTYSKKYDSLDVQAQDSARQAFRRERDEKTQAFKDILDRLDAYKEDIHDRNGWAEAFEDYQARQGWEEQVTAVEEELETKEELIG